MPHAPSRPAPEIAFLDGNVVLPTGQARAILTRGARIATIGSVEHVRNAMAADAQVVDLKGRTVVAGLIDGHAHMDREGLKGILPSLADAASVEQIVEKIAALAATRRPGEWIVTMPIGRPPTFDNMPEGLTEKRFPNRWDLDRAAPDNPVYIRSIWGYWRSSLPLVSIANSAALRLAGIARETSAPAESVQIGRDPATGEPDGIFYESNKMPVVEHTLMRGAPNFSRDQRIAGLKESMRIYNSFGTTGVFEGHGVSTDVLAAYKHLHAIGALTVRAGLVLSPVWRHSALADCVDLLKSWGQWLAGRGLGDEYLRVQGMFCEADDSPEQNLRSAAFPQTGWAGFHCAALPEAILEPLLVEAARAGIRVSGIWPSNLRLFAEVDRIAPIAGQRWVLGHIMSLAPDEIKLIKDLGLVITTHTSAFLYKHGLPQKARLGAARESEIVPLRSLLDAGVSVSLGSDNVPPSLFPSIGHCVSRREYSGTVVAADQALTRSEALHLASSGGAYLTFEENERGALEVGKLADFAVLSDDPLT
ncbi:MAG: amidohydrolase family protein [Xanthobacteraceae bacterium]|nr:amidohydrolase family protein [Xanthobacteraceae bacterium]